MECTCPYDPETGVAEYTKPDCPMHGPKPICLYSHREKGWAVIDDTTQKRMTPQTFPTHDAAREWAGLSEKKVWNYELRDWVTGRGSS